MNIPVSFEIAKLLKEKEFKPTKLFGYISKFYNPNTETLLAYGRTGRIDLSKAYFAPTISEVVMWLYEKHEILIGVICDVGNDLLFTFKIYSTKIGEERCIVNGNMYESPIETYEAVIEYTLNNLIL